MEAADASSDDDVVDLESESDDEVLPAKKARASSGKRTAVLIDDSDSDADAGAPAAAPAASPARRALPSSLVRTPAIRVCPAIVLGARSCHSAARAVLQYGTACFAPTTPLGFVHSPPRSAVAASSQRGSMTRALFTRACPRSLRACPNVWRVRLQGQPPAKKAASAPVAAGKPRAAPRKSGPKANPEESLPAAAKKAITAVAEAAKQLPKSAELLESGRVTRMKESGGGWGGGGGADTEPENHGSKDLPTGHPDCLTRYTFVVSGVLDSMFRNEAQDFIKRHGGRVTGSVSSKTTFLLCGAPLTCTAHKSSVITTAFGRPSHCQLVNYTATTPLTCAAHSGGTQAGVRISRPLQTALGTCPQRCSQRHRPP